MRIEITNPVADLKAQWEIAKTNVKARKDAKLDAAFKHDLVQAIEKLKEVFIIEEGEGDQTHELTKKELEQKPTTELMQIYEQALNDMEKVV